MQFIAKFAMVCLVGLPLAQGGQVTQARSAKPAHQTLNEQRREYEQKMQKELNQLDRQIRELKSEAVRKSSKARAEINRQILDLNRKSNDARQKLRKLENSKQASASWDDLKRGVDSAVSDLSTAYHQAVTDFNKSNHPAGH